jgi:hypothetical protein
VVHVVFFPFKLPALIFNFIPCVNKSCVICAKPRFQNVEQFFFALRPLVLCNGAPVLYVLQAGNLTLTFLGVSQFLLLLGQLAMSTFGARLGHNNGPGVRPRYLGFDVAGLVGAGAWELGCTVRLVCVQRRTYTFPLSNL